MCGLNPEIIGILLSFWVFMLTELLVSSELGAQALVACLVSPLHIIEELGPVVLSL